LLFLLAGPTLLPLWARIGGFKTTSDPRTNAFDCREWIVDNYVEIATSARFWQMLGNSRS
jgi:raffinose/stachyose/melibiose transport system permease protein